MPLLIGLGLIAGGPALVLVGAGILRPEPRVDAPVAVSYAIGVVFVDVLPVVVAGYAAYLGWRRVRFGPGFLRFEGFPIRLGTSTHVRLQVPRPPLECRLTATRRCVEERYVSDGESTSTLSEHVWAITRPVERPSARFGGGWNLPIELPVPQGPYETRLADRPPRYWELEVQGETKGVDFGATFLLPVYAASASAPEGRGLPT
jgi:hypothetical protein